MRKLFLQLFTSLLFLAPTVVSAKNQQSSCLSTHFHSFHGTSKSVKVISVDRLKKWSAWCQQGYNAHKVEQAIQPCIQHALANIRAKSNSYSSIPFIKTQKVKAYCKQQFWQTFTSTTNNNKS